MTFALGLRLVLAGVVAFAGWRVWSTYTGAIERADEAQARADAAEGRAELLELNIRGQEAARAAMHQANIAAEAAYAEREARHAAAAADRTRNTTALGSALSAPSAAAWGDGAVPGAVRELVCAATACGASAGNHPDPAAGRAH